MRIRGTAAFAPYEGDKPTISCCYAPQDARRVLPFLFALRARNYRVWYDGLEKPGGDRSARVARSLERAALTVLFLSENAFSSPLSRSEFSFAVAQGRPIVCVRLDDAPLPAGLQMQLQHLPSIPLSGLTPEAFLQSFAATPGVTQALIGDGAEGYDPNWRPPTRIRTVLLLTGAAAGLLLILILLVGARYGWFRAPVEAVAETGAVPTAAAPTPAAFRDPAVEAYLFSALDLKPGEAALTERLQAVTEASILGNLAETGEPHYYNGSNYVGGRRVEGGSVRDTADFSMLPSLTRLALTDQTGVSLLGLTACRALESLNLSNVTSEDYTPLLELLSLRALDVSGNGRAAVRVAAGLPLTALSVANCGLTDLADVLPCATLTALNISGNPLTALDGIERLASLEELNIADCAGLASLEPLLALKSLRRVKLNASLWPLAESLGGRETFLFLLV